MSGTTIDSQGHCTAWMTASWTNPTGNFDHAEVLYRLSGAADYALAAVNRTPGPTSARIDGLLPGTSYDFSIRVVNAFGRVSSGNPTATTTTPTDATVPSAPSAMAVRHSGAKVVEIVVTAAVPADWGMCRLYRATSNSFAAATQIAVGKKLTFHDEDVSYGQTLYYFAKIEDQSGNLSGVSPSSGHSVTVAEIATVDLGGGVVTTPIIATNAATGRAKAVNTGSTSKTPGAASDIAGRTITLSVSSSSNDVMVTFQGNALLSNTDLTNVQEVEVLYYLTRSDNSVLVTGAIRMIVLNGGLCGAPMVLHYHETGVSGSQVYKLRWTVAGSVNNNCGVSLSNTDTLTAIEYKR
jgi:predicted phage tail protein